MVRGDRAVESAGQGPGLYGADAHHGGAVGVGGCDDLARPGGTREAPQSARGVEQIRDALDVAGPWAVREQSDDGVRLADAGEPPVADAPLGGEPLERRRDGFGDDLGGRRALGPLASKRDPVMQEHDVNMVELHALQAGVEAFGEEVVDLARRGVANAALGRDADAGGKAAVERVADDRLGLAVAVGRREVQDVDAGVDGLTDGRHALVASRGSPDLADAAAAEREGARGAQFTERSLLHERLLLRARVSGPEH